MKTAGSHGFSVAFQGEHGAFSEEAARTFFGESTRTEPCRTVKHVFHAIERGTTQFGVVPAENSVEGSVSQTYDCLLQTSLTICGEVQIRVSHYLLGLPGIKPDRIRVVYSHPQALGQCSNFLEGLGAVQEPVYDTAGSAKMIREKNLREAAAIASETAAKLYGLEILRRDIQDFTENLTRFYVIGQDLPDRTGEDKTSIVFVTNHTPGSLYQALGELATRGINLTKIESRPIKGIPWEYRFFIDFEGHQTDPASSEAIAALKKSTTFLKILGSYPRMAT